MREVLTKVESNEGDENGKPSPLHAQSGPQHYMP